MKTMLERTLRPIFNPHIYLPKSLKIKTYYWEIFCKKGDHFQNFVLPFSCNFNGLVDIFVVNLMEIYRVFSPYRHSIHILLCSVIKVAEIHFVKKHLMDIYISSFLWSLCFLYSIYSTCEKVKHSSSRNLNS